MLLICRVYLALEGKAGCSARLRHEIAAWATITVQQWTLPFVSVSALPRPLCASIMSDDDKALPAYSDVEKIPARSGSEVPEHILKHGKDADEAMKAFEGHGGEVITLDETTNRRLLRTIDWNIMPVSMSMLRLRCKC